MADLKQLKYLLVHVVFLLSIIAVTGHLTGNLWERYVTRNEISRIRSSLYSLKDTISKIGYTYDNMHEEITGLAINPSAYIFYKKDNHSAAKKLQVFIMRDPSDIIVNPDQKRDKITFVSQQKLTSNASTITRNPTKITGVGSDFLVECPNKKACKYTCILKTLIHKRFKDYLACGCKYS